MVADRTLIGKELKKKKIREREELFYGTVTFESSDALFVSKVALKGKGFVQA